ncbi:endonuclease [Niabella ginsenosidivorans]|uniref:Endonuclease n=1 Tax=Niabella ginsenosidivorans TaxID=1176587 RepID=A0A1A9I6T0_9BACT|nr:endonuclease/exonuclease/phosphatase family protein [Niabella ginsenosidivorans]ANH82401.1 endonuclease [Niabella ginsenosidivorans]
MYKRSLFSFLFFICFLCSYSQTLNIATYNLRYDNPGDTGNLWKDRSVAVVGLIRFHDFDVFGTQEGLKNQLDDIANGLPEYTCYGKGRDDGGDKGEHSAVFYKKEKFALLKCGDFWLSETPDKPGKGWDAECCNRICSWVLLKDKATGKQFYFFNVHFDHQGKIAQVESGKLMLKKIREIAGKNNVVLTGDFNGDRSSDWYQRIASSDILKDTYKDVKYPYANNASFNAFGKTLDRDDVIDHIFISRNGKSSRWGILTDTYRGKFPSDHFPVEAFIRF